MENNTLKLFTAAKINLFLRIDGKRPDNYHDLTNIMQSIALFDEIDITFNCNEYSLTGNKDMGDIEQNIITRSWRLMKETFNLPGEIAVKVKKNIPIGAGLAGGSSNGAGIFQGVNRYFNLNLTNEELGAISLKIGSDLPFCITGGTALVKGKGDKIENLPYWNSGLVLVNNGFSVSTKECYDNFDQLPLMDISEANIVEALETGNGSLVEANLFNDLERATLPLYPVLTEVKNNMKDLGLTPLMSGSGPSVFGIGNCENRQKFIDKYKNKYPFAVSINTIEHGVYFDKVPQTNQN